MLAANDGVAHLSTFVAAGLSPHQVAALFRRGVLIRPRIGWYADPASPFDAVRAIRKGGVLGGTSAAKSYDLPMDRALHVPRDGVALISGESWALLRPALPERLRHAWDLADGRSESPIETIVLLGLIRLGIAFDIQVWLLPYHRVDFLIGGWLIIEVDGKRYHVEDEQFEADRDRDALFAAWGYRVLRFSYRQVVEELDWVLDVISTVVSRGR